MSLSSRSWFRGLAAASAVTVFAVAAGAAALADDISNTLDATVDAAAETMTLAPGGDTRTTTLILTPTNNDGKNGCNLTGSTILTVGVGSSDTGVATVSPASVTFESCGDIKTITVTPVASGTATVSATQLANTTGDAFNLAPATFTVNVTAPANTAPSVSVTGVTHGAQYEYDEVPAAGCSVNDAEDGAQSVAPVLSAVSDVPAVGLGTRTATCSYTDAGGLTSSASATYTIVDTTPPSITFEGQSPGPNPAGWNNSDVTLTWTCKDPYGVVAGTVTRVLSGEGADQSATGACTDTSGNSSSDLRGGIDIDLTAPLVSLLGGPADGGSHYFGTVPDAPECSASDALSGLAGPCVVTGYATTVGTHTVQASATDKAGNDSSSSATYTVLAWTLKGFYQPVAMNGVWNTVKGGSTVPLKFEAFAGTTELTDVSAVGEFKVATLNCLSGDMLREDAVELTTTGVTALRYDATGGQFIQNWRTPKSAGACYRVTMTTLDGSFLSALFKLK